MKKNKSEIITFKVDEVLLEAVRNVPNRSEFIRSAILLALDSICPLCSGTGLMTPAQKEHWNKFQSDHHVEKCADCQELHLICDKKSGRRLDQ